MSFSEMGSSLHRLDADVLTTAVNTEQTRRLSQRVAGLLDSFLGRYGPEPRVARNPLKDLSFWVLDYADFLDPLVTEAKKRIPHQSIEKYPLSESDQDYEDGDV